MKQGYRLAASSGLHKGDRDYQQDQVALLVHSRVQGCVLAVIADGMGGRTGGRKASDQVILTARQLFAKFDPASGNGATFLRQVAMEAHTVIKLIAVASEEDPHSTIAAALIMPDGLCHWLHSGDSRIYHFRAGRLRRRTMDHSYVQTLVKQNKMTEEEAAVHPRANVLISCLGTSTEPILGSEHVTRLHIGDVLMVCSDGLWQYFTDADLSMTLSTLPPTEASHFLVEKARERAAGGGDNLSLIVIKIEPPIERSRTTRTSTFM